MSIRPRFFSTSPQRYRSSGAQVGESTVGRRELRAGWTLRGPGQTEEAAEADEAAAGEHAGKEDAGGEPGCRKKHESAGRGSVSWRSSLSAC